MTRPMLSYPFRRFALLLLSLLATTVTTQAVDQVAVLASQSSISESDTTVLRFDIARILTVGDLVVDFTLSGAATNGSDYVVTSPAMGTSVSGSITILSGSQSASVTLTISNDDLAEFSEQITLTITDTTSYDLIGSGSDGITVLDDEPVLEIVVDTEASEQTTDGVFIVSYPGTARSTSVEVFFSLSGTAVAGRDYDEILSVVIPADENSVEVPVAIIDDSLPDDGKTLTMALTSNPGYLINPSVGSDTMTLGNDDTGVLAVDSPNADGEYAVDSLVTITVTFNHVVVVSGSPRLQLAIGPSPTFAAYSAGNGSATLSFIYQVGTQDSSAGLEYSSASALSLNGGSIVKQGTSTAAQLSLPTPGQPGSLGANSDLEITGIATGQKPVPGSVQSTDSHTSQCGLGQGISALLFLCMLAGLTLSVRRIQR